MTITYRGMALAAALVLSAPGLGLSGLAQADARPEQVQTAVIAGPGAAITNYVTTTVVASVTGSLSFANLDQAPHDVVSKKVDKRKRPLFRTKLIAFSQVVPVEGLKALKPDQTYDFYCTLHSGMTGQLKTVA